MQQPHTTLGSPLPCLFLILGYLIGKRVQSKPRDHSQIKARSRYPWYSSPGLSWELILQALSMFMPGCKQQQHSRGGRLEQDLFPVCERHLPVVDERPQSRASEHLRS